MNLPLYKGFTLEITNKWWPLTTLNRWPLYRIKIYSKMHRESTKVTVMSKWHFSLTEWADRVGTDISGQLKSEFRQLLLEQLGLDVKLKNPSCNRSDDMYGPGRVRKWPLWAGDHYTKVTVTTGLTVNYIFSMDDDIPLFQNGKFIFKIIPEVISKVRYFSQMHKKSWGVTKYIA
jgi:hypothetical protein